MFAPDFSLFRNAGLCYVGPPGRGLRPHLVAQWANHQRLRGWHGEPLGGAPSFVVTYRNRNRMNVEQRLKTDLKEPASDGLQPKIDGLRW